ncbi:MAG: corrinoid protein [Verrucomicrobia bacterium]|nr:corrinoid protein [Verrucomicrobiota bacterium]
MPDNDLIQLQDAVITGEAHTAKSITETALAEGVEPLHIVNEFLIPAMDDVGNKFGRNEYFVPELLLSARAMKASMALIRPLLAERGNEPIERVVIGTVKGDLHDIGKNLVGAILEGGGFEVFDLGVNVSPEKFIEEVQSTGAQIVGMSALLTTTMPSMKKTIQAFTEAGLRDSVKMIVGGAPVSQRFADEIGADGYGENAPLALQLAKQLVSAS